MIELLVSLLIFVIVGGLIYWIVTLLPLPQPFKNIAIVIVLVIMLIVLLSWALPRAGLHVSLDQPWMLA